MKVSGEGVGSGDVVAVQTEPMCAFDVDSDVTCTSVACGSRHTLCLTGDQKQYVYSISICQCFVCETVFDFPLFIALIMTLNVENCILFHFVQVFQNDILNVMKLVETQEGTYSLKVFSV